MSSEIEERPEGPYYTTSTTGGGPRVFHTKPKQCPHVDRSRSLAERSWSYVRWHELHHCEACEQRS